MTPHLTARHNGALVMTWLEPTAGKRHALKFAAMRDGKWTPPRTIVERDDFFVNWADFPAMTEGSRGVLFVHWLQKSGTATYAYDVVVSNSRDGGRTWAAPRVLHSDKTKTEHGFVSMAALGSGGVGVVWLDGRNMSGENGPMTLRYARLDGQLNVHNETQLDARVCECCTTAMTMTPNGPLIAYRDRSQTEIRDIAFVRLVKERWSAPALISNDGWKINGCPVNGPQLASRGNLVAAAWFTAPSNVPQVKLAFSRDGGAKFGAPLRIDGGNPVGRTDVLLLPDNSALVTWIEGAGDAAAITMRRASPDGRLSPPMKVAPTSAARGSGFPRTVLIGSTAYVAWTDPVAKRVRLARVDAQ